MTTGHRFLALAAAAALSACASTSPNLDAQFGDAVQVAGARQTLDTTATARNAGRDVGGLDARAARAAFDRYLATFLRPEPQQNAFVIGVGGRGQ